jgi:hypothetical protein
MNKPYFSVQEAADYLSEKLEKKITVRDIISHGESGDLPIGAFRSGVGEYRHLAEQVIYIPRDYISGFDPVKAVCPSYCLLVGYSSPEAALVGGSTEVLGSGQDTVDDIEKLVIPAEYLDKLLEETSNPQVKKPKEPRRTRKSYPRELIFSYLDNCDEQGQTPMLNDCYDFLKKDPYIEEFDGGNLGWTNNQGVSQQMTKGAFSSRFYRAKKARKIT